MLNEYQRREQREKKEQEQQRRAVVDSGKCPKCGGALIVNLAIVGWHHCEYLYKDSSGRPCSFQVFTRHKWGKA